MIREITLTNFMRHRSQHLVFTPGLNCIRGGNEQGKSTSLRAILYALFGTKALPVPLEDVVTHGQPVNSLRVKLVLDIGGVTYTVDRSKTGAEVNYADGVVTGQTDVTRFLCERMGVDATVATRLMVAAQNDIRGALELGPKATTELIERLSDFDQLDNLITRMQERLTLGSTGPLEEALSVVRKRLEQAQPLPDLQALEEDHAEAEAALRKVRIDFDNLDTSACALESEIQAIIRLMEQRDHLRGLLDDAAMRKSVAESELGQVQLAIAGMQAPEARLDQAESNLRAVRNLMRYQQIYTSVQPLLGQLLPRDPKEIRLELSQMWQQRKTLTEHTLLLKEEAARAHAAVLSGLCSFCGQDFSHVPEVVARNTATQAKVGELEAKIGELTANLSELTRREGEVNEVLQEAQSLMAKVNALPDLLKVDPDTREVVWTGPAVWPFEPLDLAQAEKDVVEAREFETLLNQRLLHLERAKSNLEAAAKAMEYPQEQVQSLSDKIDEASAQEPQKELELVKDQLRETVPAMRWAETQAADAMHSLQSARVEHKMALAQREQDLADVERLEGNLKLMNFNNALLKKVRQARPLIADRLWSVVLTVVSNYFSAMRGQRSVVSKDRDGFKVDGAPVETLSGSTLDILGLALRVALVRTFLPTATYLLLDEPCAAMDSSRTETTLGFLASSGFEQVLLVTHEDVSEAIADHVVFLGA